MVTKIDDKKIINDLTSYFNNEIALSLEYQYLIIEFIKDLIIDNKEHKEIIKILENELKKYRDKSKRRKGRGSPPSTTKRA